MIKIPNILTIIPARGGSKGIPRKNIRHLSGKPLIQYTIEAALKSNFIGQKRIVVSTDDDEIAEISRESGVFIPSMRPPELATDTAKAIGVVKPGLSSQRTKSRSVSSNTNEKN